MLTGQSNTVDAGPEVLSSPKRRRFSVQDKRRLVREYEATPNGERGAFLRRNGLYSSYIDNWRKLVESAEIQALEPQKRGPKPQPKPDPELERLLMSGLQSHSLPAQRDTPRALQASRTSHRYLSSLAAWQDLCAAGGDLKPRPQARTRSFQRLFTQAIGKRTFAL